MAVILKTSSETEKTYPFRILLPLAAQRGGESGRGGRVVLCVGCFEGLGFYSWFQPMETKTRGRIFCNVAIFCNVV